MSETIRGSLTVLNTIDVSRRLNQGMSVESIISQRTVVTNDYAWLRLSNATTQDVVLPNAMTLQNGWSIIIDVPATSGAPVNVKTYHTTTPVLRQNVLTDRAYSFTLVDNSSSAGIWKVNFLEEADTLPTSRYVQSFNATTDWGSASGGYYTFTTTAVTHGRGTSPIFSIEESNASDYIKVSVDRALINSSGDLSIRVPDSPDLRFAGRIIFV
jgi:hypothetical protein